MFYNEEIEKTVLSYLLKDTKFLTVSRQIVKDDFFYFTNLRRMHGAIVRTFDKWHMTLTYEIFLRILANSKLPLEEETNAQILFKEIEAIPVDPERFMYFVDQLKDLKIKREVGGLIAEITPTSLEMGNGEEILQGLNERIHKLRIDSNLLVVKRDFMFSPEFVEAREKAYEHTKQFGDVCIPFGWKKLDEYTGGHHHGEVTVVFSRTGGGKSRTLTTFAYNAVAGGRKGMFVTIEMSNIEIARLYDSRMCRLHFDSMKKSKLSEDEEQKWHDLMKMMSEKEDKGLYVVDMPRGCTSSAIEEEINAYERRHGKLDFVVVDYIMLMESIERGVPTHERVGNIVKELKQLARIKHVSILTAIQANRKVMEIEGEEVGTEHISLSDQVAAHSNNILYLYRTADDMLSNTLQVNLVKYRDGGNITFAIHTDWKIAYIGDEILSLHMAGAPEPPIPSSESIL